MKQILIAVFILLIINAKSQENELEKLEKITEEELAMDYYTGDSSAVAVILYDAGFSYFLFDSFNGGTFKLMFERTMRIKILKKEGYKYADIEIPIYKETFSEESISSIKGFTYNLVDGKIDKEKLNRKDIFKEEVNENWLNYKFAMPDVKEGSVIEVSYSIKSDYIFNLRSWYFQHDIPVVYSEYIVKIPEYFHYKVSSKGYHPLAISEKKYRSEDFIIGKGTNAGRITSNSQKYIWAAKNVPALKAESFINRIQDYATSVEFELETIDYPGQAQKHFTTTWENVSKTMYEHSKFGDRLLRDKFISDDVNKITEGATTQQEKLLKIYTHIQNNLKCNDQTGLFTDKNLNKVYQEKNGNVAEINLLLVLMLRTAGITADPVLVSTKGNGIVRDFRPSFSQFNYVIAKANIDSSIVLLDATEKFCPAGKLPTLCLNGKGLVVKEKTLHWINLMDGHKYAVTAMSNLSFDEEMTLNGNMQLRFSNQAALHIRKKYEKAGFSEEKLMEEIDKDEKAIEITDYSISDLENIYKPIGMSITIEVTEGSEAIGELITINPFIFDRFDENPFKIEKRMYPVNFPYPVVLKYITNIVVPNGYEVESLPQSQQVKMPDNIASYQILCQQNGKIISLMQTFVINKTMVLPDNYQYIKSFYNEIVSKNAEVIVMKKETEK